MLKRFEKIFLKAGEKSEVEFSIGLDDLTYIGAALKPTYEYGQFNIEVGPLSQTFTLISRGKL